MILAVSGKAPAKQKTQMETKADTQNRLRLQSGAGVSGIEEIWQCPTCHIQLKSNEIARHTEEEMERLRQMGTEVPERNGNGREVSAAATDEQRKPWTVFQKVKRNRQSRLKRTRRRPTLPPQPADQPSCPICNVNFPADQIQGHAERCLRRRGNNAAPTNGRIDEHSSDEEPGAGDGEVYEEYEWAGQKRIRVSSMLQGGYAAIGVGQPISNRNGAQTGAEEDDEDEDLNVDEDDTHIYGPPQYAESDVIAASIEAGGSANDGDANDVTNYMRRLITGHHPPPIDATISRSPQRDEASATTALPHTEEEALASNANSAAVGKPAQHYEQIIESLKAKLRSNEQQLQSKYKCLICLDGYRNPAISVACWHVHCESCWLASLSSRKLCPQCNLITTPKDLRRIYM